MSLIDLKVKKICLLTALNPKFQREKSVILKELYYPVFNCKLIDRIK